MVDRFVEAGHTVIGCGRSESLVAALRSQFGSPHRFDVVDVGQDASVAAWAQSVLATGLVPDLLINNAAIMNQPAPLWQVSAEEFQNIITINIAGTVNVIRQFVPAMVERGEGVIVNFSSGWGRSTSAEVAPYCATKFAIEGLTQAMAQELPRGMAAIPLNPGIINTEMLQTCWADGASRYPSPDRWSHKAAPFLLSLSARHNGQSLDVPG